jgi:hypothetical protein
MYTGGERRKSNDNQLPAKQWKTEKPLRDGCIVQSKDKLWGPRVTSLISKMPSSPHHLLRAAVLHVPYVMDLIPSSWKEYVSLSLDYLSLRVRMKYRSVILVGKRKEKRIESSQRWWGQPKFVFTPLKSWEWRPMRVERRRTRRQLLRLHLSQEMRPGLPKEEEEETLRRCSGKMLFISIMREKQSTVLCVYFFW